jgi:hypothetical protein
MQFSETFRKNFLIIFTRELIKNSVQKEIVQLENMLNEKKNISKIKPIPQLQKVQPIVQEKISPPKTTPIQREPLNIKPVQRKVQEIKKPTIQPTQKFTARQMLFIPEPRLPKHLEYLKPIPINEVSGIDLEKLNPLVKDRAVKIIEGTPNANVIVMGNMGTKPTRITLTKEEIDNIIKKFSDKSKIPVTEGIYRVVVENLILSAIVSEAIGSRFVIKKILPLQNQNKNYQIIPKKF